MGHVHRSIFRRVAHVAALIGIGNLVLSDVSWGQQQAETEEGAAVSTQPQISVDMVLRLGDLPPTRETVAATFAALQSTDLAVRIQALAALVRMERAATPFLIERLSSETATEQRGDYFDRCSRDEAPLLEGDAALAALLAAPDIDLEAVLSAYGASSDARIRTALIRVLQRLDDDVFQSPLASALARDHGVATDYVLYHVSQDTEPRDREEFAALLISHAEARARAQHEEVAFAEIGADPSQEATWASLHPLERQAISWQMGDQAGGPPSFGFAPDGDGFLEPNESPTSAQMASYAHRAVEALRIHRLAPLRALTAQLGEDEDAWRRFFRRSPHVVRIGMLRLMSNPESSLDAIPLAAHIVLEERLPRLLHDRDPALRAALWGLPEGMVVSDEALEQAPGTPRSRRYRDELQEQAADPEITEGQRRAFLARMREYDEANDRSRVIMMTRHRVSRALVAALDDALDDGDTRVRAEALRALPYLWPRLSEARRRAAIDRLNAHAGMRSGERASAVIALLRLGLSGAQESINHPTYGDVIVTAGAAAADRDDDAREALAQLVQTRRISAAELAAATPERRRTIYRATLYYSSERSGARWLERANDAEKPALAQIIAASLDAGEITRMEALRLIERLDAEAAFIPVLHQALHGAPSWEALSIALVILRGDGRDERAAEVVADFLARWPRERPPNRDFDLFSHEVTNIVRLLRKAGVPDVVARWAIRYMSEDERREIIAALGPGHPMIPLLDEAQTTPAELAELLARLASPDEAVFDAAVLQWAEVPMHYEQRSAQFGPYFNRALGSRNAQVFRFALNVASGYVDRDQAALRAASAAVSEWDPDDERDVVAEYIRNEAPDRAKALLYEAIVNKDDIRIRILSWGSFWRAAPPPETLAAIEAYFADGGFNEALFHSLLEYDTGEFSIPLASFRPWVSDSLAMKAAQAAVAAGLGLDDPAIFLAANASPHEEGPAQARADAAMANAIVYRRMLPYVRDALALRRPLGVCPAYAGFPGTSYLPQFPWPPPPGFEPYPIPTTMFRPSPTLGTIVDQLQAALLASDTQFTDGLFQIRGGGIALLARMERVNARGEPLQGRERWPRYSEAPQSLRQLVGEILFERPGYFRVLAFVVMDDAAIVPARTGRLPKPEEGAETLPPELRNEPLGNRRVVALAYSYRRQPGGSLQYWGEDNPSALEHLHRSGVWHGLAEPNP